MGVTGVQRLGAVAAAGLIAAWAPAGAGAAAGDLDETFGSKGRTGAAVGPQSSVADIAVQRDGRIVLGGYATARKRQEFLVMRYTADGRPDPTFGTRGRVLTRLQSAAAIQAIALQPNGRIVAAGVSIRVVRGRRRLAFAVARYRGDGRLDRTFSRDGRLVLPMGNDGLSEARGVAIERGGTILVAGEAWMRTGRGENDLAEMAALVRLTRSGRLAKSGRGTDGKLVAPLFTAGAEDVAVQPDGRIVLAGPGFGDYRAARLTRAGRTDTRFGRRGVASAAFGRIHIPEIDYTATMSGVPYAMALQRDGRIVLAGQVGEEEGGHRLDGFGVARLLPSGRVDARFGQHGAAVTEFWEAEQATGQVASEGARDVAVAPDGKIVAVGNAGRFTNVWGRFFAVARYNPDGSPDRTFGTGGRKITSFGWPTVQGAAVAFAPDGDILVAGELSPDRGGSGTAWGLLRYQGR
jgi:uncharacterized delta-60 repeat protein